MAMASTLGKLIWSWLWLYLPASSDFEVENFDVVSHDLNCLTHLRKTICFPFFLVDENENF